MNGSIVDWISGSPGSGWDVFIYLDCANTVTLRCVRAIVFTHAFAGTRLAAWKFLPQWNSAQLDHEFAQQFGATLS